MSKELVFTAFRQGHLSPNVHLGDLRAVKAAFLANKTSIQQQLARLDRDARMDIEDRIDLERDMLLNYGGSVRLMRQIERTCGLHPGELVSKEEAEMAEADEYIFRNEKAVANG